MSGALDSLYLITDRNAPPSGDLLAALKSALEGGVRLVQFREKDLPAPKRLALGREVMALARALGARIIVNGDPALADELGAAGVHLGKSSLPVGEVRATYSGLIGYSAHSGGEAAEAFAAGADFVTLSPVFPPTSKAASGPILGLEGFRFDVQACGGPVYALGGVSARNAAACIEAGAHGVALIGAILGAPDPARAADEIIRALGVNFG
ncbi:MAG: thiamine phosphate synthase [Nitrospinaceae bacterium]|nr:thiamine phosphate synthase [Nitrospinaceae bacterium]MBT3433129.1 thiamine phosphate synthase [Nitrospinaceae bacterium]MBT3820844.1 thiamine phosphate synthase [Nitrospinaceae bacterium]MBT4093805.1 thiamine phosphate synthase [Nitrospinaceae bacterium]MBT4429142.1 thiamine phosphate synthase [Nitrospinaceae bacterium]